VLRDTRRSSKPEYWERYPDARPAFVKPSACKPFRPIEPGVPAPRSFWCVGKAFRSSISTAEVMARYRVQCGGEPFKCKGRMKNAELGCESANTERSLKVRRLLREQDEAGALPAALTIYATRNPGAGQEITGLAAAVQLRLRVAAGLQALQRCSGLLNRRARGSTVATHHFTPAWLSSDSSSFVNCRAKRPTRVRVSPLAPFHAPVAQTIRAGGFEPPGCR
jgi:hypothetical protein